MTQEELILKENVMKRVRFIYMAKRVATPLVAKFAVLTGLVSFASLFVSMPHVLQNMPSLFEVERVTRFFTAAFLNTKLAIQVIALGTIVVTCYMLRDISLVFRLGNRRIQAI